MKIRASYKPISLLMILIIIFLSSNNLYAADFNYNRMNLYNNITSKILPLEAYGGNLNSSQNNHIMKSGFLTSGQENFGYFCIYLSDEKIGKTKNSDALFASALLGIILTAGIYTIAGGPVGEDRYRLTATVEIYDINKKLIKKYSNSTFYDGLDKQYTTPDYTLKTESLYKQLLKKCLTNASEEAGEINNLLVEAKYPQPSIEIASNYILNALSAKIPYGSRIAVIGRDKYSNTNLFVLQIESRFVNSNIYRIVDRTTLDYLLAEISFSYSPFVSDSDAIRVGKMSSADYIVSVHIEGTDSNQFVVSRAVAVETGIVIASYSSRFRN